MRRLAFLPRLLTAPYCHISWRTLTYYDVAQGLSLSEAAVRRFFEAFSVTRDLTPLSSGEWTSVPRTLAHALLQYRLQSQQILPLAVRKLSSYNLSGWTHAGQQRDAKSRWLHGALRQGPVLLQETRWTDGQPRDLRQSIPGVHVVASSAQASVRGLSGGVAVVLPPGWRVLNQHVVLEGRIVAAHLSARWGSVARLCLFAP